MVFNSKSRVITLIVLSSFFFLLILNYHVFSIFSKQLGANLGENDPFGIKKIYPTKQGGREWFMNMSNPKNDPNVSFTFNPSLIKQNDSSWKLDKNDKVRINVDTPVRIPEWKNVEITGYVKIDSLVNPNDTRIISDIDWVSRTDRHNENLPCYGLSLHGGIYPDGTVAWKKEIWFTGGYTKERSVPKITEPIIDRWIGWKVVVYNTNNDSAVKMESYLDNSTSNHWVKVFETTDSGKWFANSSDDEFYSANCGRSKDHIVLNSGPIVTFRTDNVVLNFKDFSIREIVVPS